MSGRPRDGEVFDGIAAAYDARRSGYPRSLVTTAVEIAGLDVGSRVVEVGCGTGKLTEELVACGLEVDAVDPGENMIAVARRRVGASDLVRYHVGRFEDITLARAPFAAVFSAAAFHWVDPSIGWSRAAKFLGSGGTIALLQPIAVRDEAGDQAQDELAGAFRRLAPEITAGRPAPRDEASIRAGAEKRRDNVSEVWAWLAHPGLAVPEAEALFGPALLTSVPRVREQTADEMWAVFETTSRYHRLSAATRTELRAECGRIIDRHGGIFRSTQLVVLVTAQRR